MRRIFWVLLIFISACQNSVPVTVPDIENDKIVGQIHPNPLEDDPNFVLCNEDRIIQYYGVKKWTNAEVYKDGKKALIKLFMEQYQAKKARKESGLIRIRFVVNCQGESGRFRILGMDKNYREKQFHSSITDQLLSITKDFDGWVPFQIEDVESDYYCYLIFKIEYGALIEIMP